MHHHTSRVQKKQSTTRPSTIIHHHHPSAVSISRSNQNIGSLFTRSNAKDQIGKRIRQEDRQGSRCVAVSLGPVNLPTPSPSPPATPCLLLVSSSTEPYSVVHSPQSLQASGPSSESSLLAISTSSPLKLLSSFVAFHERLYTPRFGRQSYILIRCVCFTKEG